MRKKAPAAGRTTTAGKPLPRASTKSAPSAAKSRTPGADLQIGARIRHARLLAGIRMRELAERVGCTEGMISKIENARVVPSLPMLQRLVEALGRDLSSFFGSDPDSPGIM